MFEWHFLWPNIKKRFPRTLLGAAATAVLFLLFWQGWVLPNHSGVQGFIILVGVSMSFFYLLGGIGTAVAATGFFAIYAVLLMLPSPWNAIGFLSIFIVIPLLLKQRGKRRFKQLLLQEHPDMTKAQAAEITATTYATYNNSADDIRREADAVLDAGFLMLEYAPLRERETYLLSLRGNEYRLYTLDRQQRMQDLVNGLEVEPAPGDIHIGTDSIDGMTLRLKRRFGAKRLHLAVSYEGKDYNFLVTGSASAKQVEEYITAHSSIPVDNQVQIDREPLTRLPATLEDIIQADDETVERRRSARRGCRVMTALSVFSLALVVLGAVHPALHILLLLCPAAVTVFYVRRQGDVRLDGSKQGKPGVVMAYFFNPIVSAMLAWVIIIEVMELTCLSRHPFAWLFGILGAAVFLIYTLVYVRESHGKVGFTIGLTFLAVAVGAQITAVALFLIHL